jgi:hypothetical protein
MDGDMMSGVQPGRIEEALCRAGFSRDDVAMLSGLGVQLGAQRCPSAALAGTSPTTRSVPASAVLTAMADVQGKMINPRPNATGVINDGQRGMRTYRYCTLDVILEQARPLLWAAQIHTSHYLIQRGQYFNLVTVLTHAPTEQFLGEEFPVTVERHAHMDLKGVVTYAKRANMEAHLNISTESDRDAGEGTPDEEREEGPPPRAGSPRAYNRDWLLGRSWAEMKQDPGEAGKNAFTSAAVTLLKVFRANPDIAERRFERSQRDAWNELRHDMTALLIRAFGPDFGGAWGGVYECRTLDDLDLFRVQYDQQSRAAVEKLRAQHPTAVAYLTEHLITEAKRIDARARLKTDLDREVAAIEEKVAEPEKKAFPLYDQFGEVASDAMDDPVAFAHAYARLWLATDADQIAMLDDNNEAALDWIGEFPEAVAVLDDQLGPVVDATDEATPSKPAEPAVDLGELFAAQPAAAPELPEDNEHTDLSAPIAAGLVKVGTGDLKGAVIDASGAPPGPALDVIPEQQVIEPPSEVIRTADSTIGAEDNAAELAAWDDGPLRLRPAVQMPTARGGTPNMARYLEAVESDLASVNDQPTMAAWLAANEPIYLATDFPIATRIRAMKMATARRLLLGMPPSADGKG